MFNDATIAAFNVIGYIFIGIGILVLIGLVVRFIGWICEAISEFRPRRKGSVALWRERTAMKMRAYKTAHEMIRDSVDYAYRDKYY